VFAESNELDKLQVSPHNYTEDWWLAALKTYLQLGYLPLFDAPRPATSARRHQGSRRAAMHDR